jgi:hypothetical protein
MIAVVAGGVVALAAIVIAIASVAGKSAAPAPAASSTASALASGAMATASAPRETTVDVWIEAAPSRAKIVLDGKPLKAPFRAAVPKDASPHAITVSADGFAPETRTISFDRDVHLELQLRPLATSVAAQPQATTTATPTVSAGSDLQVAKPKHNIDEKDPY